MPENTICKIIYVNKPHHLRRLKYAQPSTQTGRTDVNSVTNWNVPLVWEGTFDPLVIDDIYKKMDPRVAVVVFAVGRYTRFLKKFIETGEKYFLVGFKVTYYIHTDRANEVPKIGKMESSIWVRAGALSTSERFQNLHLGNQQGEGRHSTPIKWKEIRNNFDFQGKICF